MIEISKDFNIEKAQEVLQKYSDNRELLKTLFVNDLITYYHNFSRNILYHELLIQNRYPKDIITSVLKDLEYDLLKFVDASEFKRRADLTKPECHLIVFGPAEG